MTPGKLIKYHRTRKGMTQKELANGICSISYLSKLENDSIEPNEDVLRLIANKLGIKFNQKHENDTLNKEKIYEWYRSIKKRDAAAAKQELNILKKITAGSNSFEIIHLFEVMLFCYEITFNISSKNVKLMYDQLKPKENLFNDETLYYFFKFESLFFFYDNDLKSSLESLKQSEKIHNRLDFVDLDLYYNLSLLYRRTYQIYISINYAQKLLEEALKALEYETIIYANMIIVANYIGIGEYDLAKDILIRLKNNKENITQKNCSIIYHNLGYLYYQDKEFENALYYLNKSLSLRETDNDKIGTIYIMGLVYYSMSNYQKLKSTIMSGQEIAHKYNIKKYIYKFFILESKMQKTTLTSSFIEKMEKEIIPYFVECGEQRELMRHLKLLGDIYFEVRQYKKSAEYHMRTQHLYTNTFRVEDYE